MTLEETRQLGIEFERRVQIMIPEKEFSDKLDTETIYSFLNQYQDKFIHELYRSLDNIQSPSKPSEYVETILSGLLSNAVMSVTQLDNNTYQCILPYNFGLYLSSSTEVETCYSYKNNTTINGVLSNTMISRSKLELYLLTVYDSMRILRNPIVYFDIVLAEGEQKPINLLCDRYTTPIQIRLSFYKIPKYMNLFTSTPCELPMIAFEDLVNGAVELYIEYVAGAEEKRRKQIQQALQRAREDERDARRGVNNLED